MPREEREEEARFAMITKQLLKTTWRGQVHASRAGEREGKTF